MQSDTGEAWGYFGAEWDAHAGRGTAADVLAMGLVNVRCCPLAQSWTDFITYQYQQFLQQYDWDGFYLDNSIPASCLNSAHAPDHHNRVLIFACRELMRRFYAITKLNDPRNLMVCHMSTRLCIPVLSFCDAYVDGEQYHWALQTFDGDYMALTPPARVRAELMGRNWGLIPLFLPELSGPPMRTPDRTRELLALMLPHQTRFWIGACHRETLQAALDALDEFGMAQSEFLPYWSNAGVVTPQSDGSSHTPGPGADPRSNAGVVRPQSDAVLVSAWRHPEGRVLLIVSNLSDEPRQVALDLDLGALGLPAAPAASLMMDEGEVALAGRTLTVTVPPRDFRLVRLAP